MAAVVALNTIPARAVAHPIAPVRREQDSSAGALIDRLRLVGLRCRSARKAPPIETCHRVPTTGAAKDAALERLMGSLPQALGRMPVLFAPGTPEMSFDEAWLLRLFQTIRDADALSSLFLLRSRVPVHARRGLVFFVNDALSSAED